MRTPNLGNPPTKSEIIDKLENQINNTYSFGPLKYKESIDKKLIFQSQSISIEVELTPINGNWGDDFESIQYKISEKSSSNVYKKGKYPFSTKYPPLSWNKAISRMIMTISGAINGLIRKNDIK